MWQLWRSQKGWDQRFSTCPVSLEQSHRCCEVALNSSDLTAIWEDNPLTVVAFDFGKWEMQWFELLRTKYFQNFISIGKVRCFRLDSNLEQNWKWQYILQKKKKKTNTCLEILKKIIKITNSVFTCYAKQPQDASYIARGYSVFPYCPQEPGIAKVSLWPCSEMGGRWEVRERSESWK